MISTCVPDEPHRRVLQGLLYKLVNNNERLVLFSEAQPTACYDVWQSALPTYIVSFVSSSENYDKLLKLWQKMINKIFDS